LSLANRFSFRHNDLNDLERKIKKSTGRIFIAVESVYSMDGDECPLIELTRLAEENGCVIVLDEAHTTGVMGHHGSGFASSLGLEKQIPIRIYTFGKALGTHGACVICSDRCRQYLINFARPFIYTTALPPHNVLSIDCAFRFLRQKPELLMALEKNIKKYTSLVHDLVERTESRSAIQTIIRPGNQSAKRLSAVLRSAGFDVRAILSPTVPEGKERLRISIHSYNTESEIEQLTEIVKRHVL